MGLIRTYVDAGVLIAAARSSSRVSQTALSILDDPSREFIASEYLRLEVIPKARFHGSAAELALYEEFFLSAALIVPFHADHFPLAFEHASKYGLAAFDALHLTVASATFCEEFVTSERPTSPVFRFPGMTILTIH